MAPPTSPGAAGRRGALLVVLSMASFATLDALGKIAVADISIIQILWLRYLALTMIALWMGRRHGFRGTLRSDRPVLQAGNALLLMIESATFVYAFSLLPLADVHSVAASSPLIVVALAVVLLGERVTVTRWLAVLAGFFGVLVILRPGFANVDWKMLLPLVGALQWALYQIGVRVNSRDDSAETILIWTALVGLVVTSLGVPFVWRTPDLTGALVLGGIVLAGSLGQIALIHAYRVSEASALQPFSYTLLVFAALLGFAVFGDVPGPFVFVGAVIIVASGLFAQFSSRARD